MKHHYRRYCIVLIIMFSTVGMLFAHPHVLIDVRLLFEYDGAYCTGFWQEWTFDPIFSAELIEGWDKDRNRTFNKTEQQMLYNQAFINLKNYGFYTLIRKGKHRITPSKVEQFSAWIEKNQVTYKFFVPLTTQEYSYDFNIAIFDTTYFCAIRYKENFAEIIQKQEGMPIPQLSHAVNKNFPVYYNPQGSKQDMTTYSKPAPGLLTAYPEEIVVSAPKQE
ncbi:MAG TPA: DUF1007 family protein [Spirochaetales bacterium]|nr:DUF1007 family protein [Spirochaetales bacterium]HRV27993.1 DUF1007 family protein [Spirochaetia bacterium]